VSLPLATSHPRRFFGALLVKEILMRSFVLSMTALAVVFVAGCEEWNKDKGEMSSDNKSMTMSKKSLYDRLGGRDAIAKVVDDFVPRAAGDKRVNFTRQGVPGAEWQATDANVAHLKMGLVDFFSKVTGGPDTYKGKDMKSLHANMQITNAEFAALAEDLSMSLDKVGVKNPEKGEVMALAASTHDAIVTKP
jgi:hemoglobin